MVMTPFKGYQPDDTVPASPVTRVVLAADVVNATTAYADVTGLSFPVVAGTRYLIRGTTFYTTNATTTGTNWALNGPAAPTLLMYRFVFSSGGAGVFQASATVYDHGGASSTGSNPVGVATIEGVIVPSVDGTVVVRFKSEVAVANAVTANAGSYLEYEAY